MRHQIVGGVKADMADAPVACSHLAVARRVIAVVEWPFLARRLNGWRSAVF